MLLPSSRENSLERPEKHSGAEVDEGTIAEEDDNEEEEEDEEIDDDDVDDEDINDDSNDKDMLDVSDNEDDLDRDDDININVENDDSDSDNVDDNCDDIGDEEEDEKSKVRKRKFLDFDGSFDASNASLRALKRLTRPKSASNDVMDGILSNEDFQKIKELMAKKDLKEALSNQGFLRKCSDFNAASFKIPSSEQLSTKRVDPAKLEANIKRKLSMEERLALVKEGREDRGKYVARRAVKQKKTNGLSNRQKEHKKAMPFAAKKAKVARSRQEKRKQRNRAGKQFRGKKAWK